MRFRKHAEVEALAQAEIMRLGRSTGKPLPMSTWEPSKKPKTDGKNAKPKTNRHRGHRNRKTGRGGKKKG